MIGDEREEKNRRFFSSLSSPIMENKIYPVWRKDGVTHKESDRDNTPKSVMKDT